jgi:hypothetical protein
MSCAAHNTPNNEALSFDMALLKLSQCTIVVAPCRPSFDRVLAGRHGVDGRDVVRTQRFIFLGRSAAPHEPRKPYYLETI